MPLRGTARYTRRYSPLKKMKKGGNFFPKPATEKAQKRHPRAHGKPSTQKIW